MFPVQPSIFFTRPAHIIDYLIKFLLRPRKKIGANIVPVDRNLLAWLELAISSYHPRFQDRQGATLIGIEIRWTNFYECNFRPDCAKDAEQRFSRAASVLVMR